MLPLQVLSGDLITDVSLAYLAGRHCASGATATVLLAPCRENIDSEASIWLVYDCSGCSVRVTFKIRLLLRSKIRYYWRFRGVSHWRWYPWRKWHQRYLLPRIFLFSSYYRIGTLTVLVLDSCFESVQSSSSVRRIACFVQNTRRRRLFYFICRTDGETCWSCGLHRPRRRRETAAVLRIRFVNFHVFFTNLS